ncbi:MULTISPECIES: ABC transporter substrate-binding protein [Streptomyces]|uniref:Substrate-binding domain-containing protein n=1 Tax=Streptomyces lycii TaxID=2654337 RepID=A0ABQ7FB24_9ACTN|nr:MULTISPECIES: ABC transporter substrate-binding protein [Streptomyces]KAF4406151.1 substrate-binding domain-containing protein [Streptomyces lycii]PGH51923.1 BMP family ABC transporter substrate-binding protein [Streptomyces sp. Ru87]
MTRATTPPRPDRRRGRPARAATVLAAALSLLAAAALSGCSDAGTTAEGGEGRKPYIAIVSKGFQQQFWQAVKKGAEREAEKRGVTISFEGPATETEVEAQVNMVSNSLGRKPDALGLAALDSRAVEPMLKQAERRGTPVIAFDSGVDSDIPLTTAATDNRAAAAEAAEHMAEEVGGKGKVALVVHSQTSGSGVDRRDGFVEWMEKNAPGVELLPVQYGGGDQTKSADITKAIIASNPDVKGIYGSNEGSAMGVIQGVKESGRDDISTVGFDSGQGQINAIEEGRMAGAITQNPVRIGEQVVAAAVKAVKGEKLPETIDTGYYWYDKSNIDDPRIQEVLYR